MEAFRHRSASVFAPPTLPPRDHGLPPRDHGRIGGRACEPASRALDALAQPSAGMLPKGA